MPQCVLCLLGQPVRSQGSCLHVGKGPGTLRGLQSQELHLGLSHLRVLPTTQSPRVPRVPGVINSRAVLGKFPVAPLSTDPLVPGPLGTEVSRRGG